VLDANSFARLQSLTDIPGKRIAVIGIGGGSDGVQAAMLAGLLEGAGKKCPCVVSVRKKNTTSQGAGGSIGEARTVQNHGGKISEGVYRITPESTGSGRFLEHIPAGDSNVFLVIDKQDGRVHEQIEEVLRHVEGVDTIIAVDTGGDALYSVTDQDQAKTTPDQDLRILAALRQVSVPVLTCEIACGVDSPVNAEKVLQAAGARYYEPSPSEVKQILWQYQRWEMDGTNPEFYGKTSLAWQAALQGKTGYTCLPLPEGVVLDANNPWDPFVYIATSMQGMFLMPLERHLGAIGE
jgi:hypothetical protein